MLKCFLLLNRCFFFFFFSISCYQTDIFFYCVFKKMSLFKIYFEVIVCHVTVILVFRARWPICKKSINIQQLYFTILFFPYVITPNGDLLHADWALIWRKIWWKQICPCLFIFFSYNKFITVVIGGLCHINHHFVANHIAMKVDSFTVSLHIPNGRQFACH